MEKSLVAVLKRCQFLTSGVWCFLGHSAHARSVGKDEFALCLWERVFSNTPSLPLLPEVGHQDMSFIHKTTSAPHPTPLCFYLCAA